jgi:microcompartment protein CcmK/EutM
MKIGRVAATVVATVKHPVLDHRRLLFVDILDLEGRPTGRDLIAVDAVGAGAGETVLVLDEGNGARQVLQAPQAPVRAVIVGIVDDVETTEKKGNR